MRIFMCLLVLTAPVIVFGQQYEYGFLKEYFFGRLPGARAEAMGKAYAAIDGDMTTTYFNPAGAATIKGLVVNGSTTLPNDYKSKATYQNVQIGYKFNKYLIAGLSMNHFYFGEEVSYWDEHDQMTFYTPQETGYTFTLASQPVKNLMIGLNTNYLVLKKPDKTNTVFYFDFGAIQKFEFAKKETSGQSLNLGASISNFNKGDLPSHYKGYSVPDELPVTTRFGVNYQLTLDKHWLVNRLKSMNVLVQTEFQNVLNSRYETGIRGGVEMTLFEFISLRAGYYCDKEYNYDSYQVITYKLSYAPTYGIGIHFPFYKWGKIPLNIDFDYTVLNQPPQDYTYYYYPESFSSYSLRVNWIFRDLKK